MKIFHIQAAMPLCTNTFLLIGDQGHAVAIDPNAPAQRYLDVLKENNAQLAAILLTHAHYDHMGSVAQLRRETGASLMVSELDSNPHMDERLFPPLENVTCYEDGNHFSVDDMDFQVIATPGHTSGSVCLLCGNVLFSGDTLFCGDIGRTDLETGSMPQMNASLCRLAAKVPDEVQVLPGHGPFSTMGQEKENNYYLRAAMEEQQ